MLLRAFSPDFGSGALISATTTPTPLALQPYSASQCNALMVSNAGPDPVFIRIANTADTTAPGAADMRLLAGVQGIIYIGVNSEARTLRAATASGTASLHVIAGVGGV
jgi:hypothetical protein